MSTGSKPGRKSKKTQLSQIHDAPGNVKDHCRTMMKQVRTIKMICINIYKKLPFRGKEHHYQAALEEELRDIGYHVQQEVARTLHYKKENGDVIQLPHDIRGREDLVLHNQRLIIELKQTGKLTDKEFNQICRYMHERKMNEPNWGENTCGMLINFGDNDLEIWYMFYIQSRITRVLVCKSPCHPLSDHVDTYDSSMLF